MITSSTEIVAGPAAAFPPRSGTDQAAPAGRQPRGWHYDDECRLEEIVQAFARLHQEAHGGPVSACRREPCAGLVNVLAPDCDGDAEPEHQDPPG